MEDAHECLPAKQSDGKIAAVARDEFLRFTAASEGWLYCRLINICTMA